MTRDGSLPGSDTSIPTAPNGAPTGNPGHRRRLILLSALLVTMVTATLLLVSAEVVLRLRVKEPYMFDRRLMFFSEGRNFVNKAWGGYGYEPHATIHARTYYITELDPQELVQEYDYRYATNSLGRVQRNDVDSLTPTILFLGDSFTEGQGAEPWFYRLEADWPRASPYQLVNGGTLGTGVEDWGRLHEELSARLQVAKAVVIYIGDDWHRPVWQFSPQMLACLQSSSRCVGDENFYGLPADSAGAAAAIDRMVAYRVRQLVALRDSAGLLRRTAVYKHLVRPAAARVRRALRGTPTEHDNRLTQMETSKGVVRRLVERLGRDNVLFVFLPQHHEVGPGPNVYSRLANEFVVASGLRFVDGRARCGLAVGDYYPHDGHPNPGGYAKIERCVRRAATEAFGPAAGTTAVQ